MHAPALAQWVRAPVIVAIAFASALAYGGTVVREWVRQNAVVAAPAAPQIAAPAPPKPRRAHEAGEAIVPAVPTINETPAPRPAAARPRAQMREAPAPRVATPEETAQLVLDAMAALRRNGDARRAQGLLDEYLRRNPDGPLAEEALALSIEAASTLHEDRARALAARYLAAFPHGRFREAAERAASRSTL